ncbi:hypothetical protein EBA29_01895 [Bacillus velezensis]|nr:hypothetical protein EBA29_01895 [Bacillus velezensis]
MTVSYLIFSSFASFMLFTSYELELIVKIFLMIVYQPNFLFLADVKACQFALSLLNKTYLTHIEQRKPD